MADKDKFRQLCDTIKQRYSDTLFVAWEHREVNSWSVELEIKATANRFRITGNDLEADVSRLLRHVDDRIINGG